MIKIQRPRCWGCICDQHYDTPTPHTWMDDEDAAAAKVPWPMSEEDKARHPCACRCAGGPGACEVIKPKGGTPDGA